MAMSGLFPYEQHRYATTADSEYLHGANGDQLSEVKAAFMFLIRGIRGVRNSSNERVCFVKSFASEDSCLRSDRIKYSTQIMASSIPVATQCDEGCIGKTFMLRFASS